MEQIERIKESIKQRPYLFVIILLGYLVLNMLVNKTYLTFPGMINTIRFGFPFVLFAILIPLLLAINVNLIFYKVDEFRMINKGTIAMGIFVGLLGGACPGCFIGLFPAVLGIFGVSASLSILPLYGFELQAGSAVLLTTSIYFLSRKKVCRRKIKKFK